MDPVTAAGPMNAPQTAPRRWRTVPFSRTTFIAALLLLGSALVPVAVLLGEGAPWWADLLSPFVLHAIPGAALAALLWAFERRWPLCAVAAAVVATCLSLAVPLWTGAVAADPDAPTLTLLHINAHFASPDPQAVAELVRDSGADLAVIVELSPPLAERMAALPAPWRPLIERPSRDSFGIGVYARQAATATRAPQLGHVFPTVEVVWRWAEGEHVIRGVHPMPPFTAYSTHENRAHIAELASWVTGERRPTIVMGDLNATLWSASWAPIEAAGMRSAMRGHGNVGTWPSALGGAGITIDHVLIPDALAVRSIAAVEVPGSDHRGLRVVLARRAAGP